MQLVWAENVARHTNGKVLILAPLAVGGQTVREGEKFGIEVYHSRDGKLPEGKHIVVTNYEKLHLFNPTDFTACICDESSILKHFTGATQMQVTRFMSKLPYRLLCTATAAPNDFIELGTSSEALGELSNSDMLTRFFKQLDDKGQKKEKHDQERDEKQQKHFAKLSFRVSQTIGQWRLKRHAVESFWRWVCSWARACRKPSDLGFDDARFVLPELREKHHIIMPSTPPEGMLFCLPAFGLREERDERRRTMKERCEFVAKLADHKDQVLVWCHMNQEGEELEKAIPGSKNIQGSDSDEEKEQAIEDFQSGHLRVLISKSKIFGFGVNLQNCAHVVTFASHSYEQFYQSVRRCWRFGQTRPVQLDVVATEGERGVFDNMMRKSRNADLMFTELVKHMNAAEKIARVKTDTKRMEVPSWLPIKS